MMAGLTHRKVTELKVMVPMAPVTVTRCIYTHQGRKVITIKKTGVPAEAKEDQVTATGGHN